jgi:hypothetical protein
VILVEEVEPVIAKTDTAAHARRRASTALLALLALLACAALAGGCGRLGFEAPGAQPGDGSVDGAADGASDGPIDGAAVAVCPADTAETHPGGAVCIEKVQRGSATWTDAKLACVGLGRRLCGDAEWLDGCTNAAGVSAMSGDDWEWVAEQMNDVAQKRGSTGCTDMSSHEIFVAPYGYRCCVDR